MKHLLPLFLLFSSAYSAQAQCDCPAESAPVCAIDENGQFFVMANACEAECYNLEVLPNETCLGDFDLNNPNCIEELCVVDVEGNAFVLPICLAEGLGMEVVGFGDCSVNENDGGGDEFDYCEQPVCAVDFDGNLYNLPYCEAEALGLLVLADGSCDGIEIEDGDDEEEEEDNVDYCDQLVCSLDELGNFQSLSICEAEALNYTILFDDVCEELFNVVEEGNGSACEEQVCLINPNNGLIIEQSICFAEVLGWPIVGQGDCSDIVIDETDEGTNGNADCETMVCIQTPEGEIFQQPLCIAEILGFEILDSDACDLDIEVDPTGGTGAEGLDDDDCETMVCILTPEGEIFQQPYCIAVLNNFEILAPGNCDVDLIDDEIAGGEELDPNDCETLVCMITPEGQIFTQPYCLAILLGFEIIGDGNCVGLNEEDNDGDDGENEEEEPFGPLDLEDLGAWLYETLGVFIDHNEGFEIIEVRGSGAGSYDIELAADQNEFVQLQVSDMNGRLVVDRTVDVSEGRAFPQIDLSEQESGVYILRILGDNNVETLKIMYVK